MGDAADLEELQLQRERKERERPQRELERWDREYGGFGGLKDEELLQAWNADVHYGDACDHRGMPATHRNVQLRAWGELPERPKRRRLS